MDASITRKFGGTGLGLSISNQILALMGGQIRVISEPGQGSEFWFAIRLEKQSSAPEPNPWISRVCDLKILVADDNITSRDILTRQLKAWGVRVVDISGQIPVQEVLNQAQISDDPFTTAFLNMSINGTEKMPANRQKGDYTDLDSVQFVLMVPPGRRIETRQLERMGYAAYLSKPIGYSGLVKCFEVLLKDSAPEEAKDRQEVKKADPLPSGNKERILLAEDSVINQQVITGMLKKMGYLHVDVVTNGLEALAALERVPYDLVLMDIQMPELDGLEATRRIRSRTTGVLDPQVPIIALTAHAMKGHRSMCFEAGMNEFITKPINSNIFHKVLTYYLSTSFSHLEGEKPPLDSASFQINDTTENNKPLSVFDHDMLKIRLLNDERLIHRVLGEYIKDLPLETVILKGYIAENRMDSAGAQAHKMKGSAANVGAVALGEAVHAVEKVCKQENTEGVKALMPDLDRLVSQTIDQIKEKVK